MKKFARRAIMEYIYFETELEIAIKEFLEESAPDRVDVKLITQGYGIKACPDRGTFSFSIWSKNEKVTEFLTERYGIGKDDSDAVTSRILCDYFGVKDLNYFSRWETLKREVPDGCSGFYYGTTPWEYVIRIEK